MCINPIGSADVGRDALSLDSIKFQVNNSPLPWLAKKSDVSWEVAAEVPLWEQGTNYLSLCIYLSMFYAKSTCVHIKK